MLNIVSVSLEGAEFDHEAPGQSQLTLSLGDTDGDTHTLVFREQALVEFVSLFRELQAQFPGALGAH